jgi:raffinose/stachyose/melibiose transport system substrate-binding protein
MRRLIHGASLLGGMSVVLGCSLFLQPVSRQSTTPPPDATIGATDSPALAPPIPTAEAESVVIHWWHSITDAAQRQFLLKAVRDFEAQHPAVAVEETVVEAADYNSRLAAALRSGPPPDLFQSAGDYSVRSFAAAGYLQDITDAMGGDWGGGFLPAARGLYASGGRQYGAPFSFSVVGVWYNKALFRRAGIDAPPADWDDFLADIRVLKNNGIVPITLGEGDEWSGAFWWEFLVLRLGGSAAIEDLLGGKTDFTAAPFVGAGERLAELISLHPFQPGFLDTGTYPDASAVFGDGNAAMHLMGEWESQNQRETSSSGRGLGADLGWFPFPSVSGGAGGPDDFLGGGNGWLVGRDAPAPALDFLKFITGGDFECLMIQPGAMPAALAAGECLAEPFPRAVWQAAGKAGYFQVYYDLYFPSPIGQAVNHGVRGLFTGSLSPAEVAESIDEALLQAPLS